MCDFPDQSKNQDGISSESVYKLMVSGFICPKRSCVLPAEVKRGMPLLSKEGLEVGKVAAVVLNNGDHKATYLLLSHLPERDGYWLVPVGAISEVNGERVQLSITAQAIENLSQWHSK